MLIYSNTSNRMKMPDKKEILRYLSTFGVAGLDVLFCILALALNDWSKKSINVIGISLETTAGLWKLCLNDECIGFDIVPDWLGAVRAFAFLGLFTIVGATVTSVLYTFFMKDKKSIIYLTIGLAAGSGLCMMIAMAIYAANLAGPYGGGFALCIIAWLLGWVLAGIWVAIMKQKGHVVTV